MATSGYIWGSFSGTGTSNVRPFIYWSITQSSSGNYSDVSSSLYFRKSNSSWNSYNLANTHTNSSNIDGSTDSTTTNFDLRPGLGDYLIRTRTARIYHNSDGTRSCYLGWSGDTHTSLGTYSFGETATFDTITRATAVTTSDASSVGETSATVGGNVTDAGIPACSSRGIYWGTSSGSQPNQITSGSGGGTFSVNMTGLARGTTYYYKAFSYNSSGERYGAVKSFTTTATTPTVTTTSPATSVSYYSAVVSGNVTDSGGASVTERGVCYNTSGTPTTADGKGSTSSGTGAFDSNLTGLSVHTTYYARAYAINSVGTAYGSQISFTTLIAIPTVTTSATVSNRTTSGAKVSGEVTSSGGAPITERGFVFALTANPTTGNSKVTVSGTTGTMEYSLTGLTSGTTYHVRAFATNSEGTGYGEDRSFTTLPNDPSGLEVVVTGKTTSSLTWTKGLNGNYTIVRRQLNSPPANAASGTLVYNGTGNNTSDSGMNAGGHYYYRAWASTTADGLVAVSSSYTADDIITIANFANPENALVDDTNYATVPANNGKLYCQVSKDGGVTWSNARELTFTGSIETLSFGTGSTTLWDTTLMGSDISDANLRIKLTGGSLGLSNQTFKNFGFVIDAASVLTGLQVQAKAAYDGTNILLYFIKANPYYGTSPLPIGEGSLAYDTTEDAPVYYDGNNWKTLAVVGEGGTGTVVGPESSSVGNIVVWNSTDGIQIGDSGTALPAGTLVGTTATQTLTNKTINGDNNTISNLSSGMIRASSKTGNDATLVTGTKGTSGNLSAWNADGDLVDGPALPTGNLVGTTATQTLTGKTIDGDDNTLKDISPSSIKGGTDDWKPVIGTWTYASATTINVPSGAQNIYAKGDKLLITQQLTDKYFFVLKVEDTRLTVTGGSNYSVADATITAAFYSKAISPAKFPGWFDWAPTTSGITVGSGSLITRFTIIGKTVHFFIRFELGTGSAITGRNSFSLPVPGAGYGTGLVFIQDTGWETFQGQAFWNTDNVYVDVIGSGATYAKQLYFSSTVPMTWVSTDWYVTSGTYEMYNA